MCAVKDTRYPIEILAPEGPHETISIAAEQAAPMADLAAFSEQLSLFTREDYYGDAPYELLVRSSQFSWNQYDQFAAVLLKAAHAAGVEQGIAEAAVQMYRDIFIDMAGEANTILSAIRAAAVDEEHKDMVSVLSIPCGSGKSTAPTRLIHDVIRRNDGKGLIIVTDSVDRMNDYWNPEKDNSPFDDTLQRFIRKNQNKVAVISSQNYDQMKIRQHYAPVAIITTQRYFSWTPDRIQDLLRWEKGIRPLIIFDEAPYLGTERDVSPATINAVASALRMRIEAADEKSRDAKQKAIVLWEKIRSMLLALMDKLEYTPELQYAFIHGAENDELKAFLAYVQEHCSQLDTNTVRIVQMAEDVMRLLEGWGVYSHRDTPKSGKYESKFTVHVDYRELLTGLGAKVIVLDGTADVSPMYEEDCIHKLPTRSYSRSLSYSLLNQMLLGMPGEYLTFAQCQKEGGKIKKGAKSQMVVFWKWVETEDEETHEKKQFPFLRYYNVFHISQCEGLAAKHEQPLPNTANVDETAENIIAAYIQRSSVRVIHESGDRAYYTPFTDRVVLPCIEQFAETAEYYSTAFHELTHSTGHVSRLNRLEKTAFSLEPKHTAKKSWLRRLARHRW